MAAQDKHVYINPPKIRIDFEAVLLAIFDAIASNRCRRNKMPQVTMTTNQAYQAQVEGRIFEKLINEVGESDMNN